MLVEVIGCKIEVVVSLFTSHLLVNLQVSLHHEKFLTKCDKADTIVEIAILSHFIWRNNLLSAFFAAEHIYEAEAFGHQVFPNGIEQDSTENGHYVNLSLFSTENFL